MLSTTPSLKSVTRQKKKLGKSMVSRAFAMWVELVNLVLICLTYSKECKGKSGAELQTCQTNLVDKMKAVGCQIFFKWCQFNWVLLDFQVPECIFQKTGAVSHQHSQLVEQKRWPSSLFHLSDGPLQQSGCGSSQDLHSRAFHSDGSPEECRHGRSGQLPGISSQTSRMVGSHPINDGLHLLR